MPDRRQTPNSAIARSCGATAALLPVFPELFRGINALGSRPVRLARTLARLGIGPRSRVLDLGCGKGAVAVEIASRLRCRVVGVDALEAFVSQARALARRRGVAHLCRFLRGDVHAWASARRFDAAIMLNVTGAPAAAALLRRHTRPGGLFVVDDACAADRAGRDGRESLRAQVARGGDTIIEEFMPTPSAVRRSSASLVRRLEANARRLAAQRPELRKALHAFLSGHRTAAEWLGGPLRPITWTVRRNPRRG